MKLYLDDDSVDHVFTQLLRKAGHEVQIPADVRLSGQDDPVHLRQAILVESVLLTRNHHDFALLHELILAANGRHPGILVVRRDNNPKRDLGLGDIVHALHKLLAAGVPLPNNLHILNHWR